MQSITRSSSSRGYPETFIGVLQRKNANETQRIPPGEPTQAGADRTAECGNFGNRPSDLFLKIYCDASVVSPPLLGSRGVVNLSIIFVIPNIIQHHYDCIVRAESEVFLAPNLWQASKSASKICDALLELWRRAMKKGKRIVVKIHVIVGDAEMASDEVKPPKRSDIPGIDFELVDFHQPIFGTFHCKFMIVDRKMALLNSNNIHDRPNVGMMIHLGGPIVTVFGLGTCAHPFRCLIPGTGRLMEATSLEWIMNMPRPGFRMAAKGAQLFKTLQLEAGGIHDGDVDKGGKEDHASFGSLDAGVPFISGTYQTITEHLNAGNQPDTHASMPYEPPAPSRDEYTPHILHTRHGEYPMVLISRAPNGNPGSPASGLQSAQDAAWLAGLKYAHRKVFIQSPTLNVVPVVEGILNAVRRGVECILYIDVCFNDGGEALPGQGGTNEEVSKTMFTQITDEEKEKLKLYWYTGKHQIKPVNATARKRNCHATGTRVQLVLTDGPLTEVHQKNSDTQSWYHSQEVNVMVDNLTVCEDWFDGIWRNQNTHLHELEKDGIYRDKDGIPLTDSTGVGTARRDFEGGQRNPEEVSRGLVERVGFRHFS
ncbi:hypothetical protein BDR05DRAFT_975536 [Suillus weaverae]|nr:hypothetical protein BDR05DRAFT_975536 [Suillus weaverae]